MGGPLAGLRVVDLTTTLTGTHISQTLADFGCDVVQVEPPGGSPLREQPAWPFWARGKQSTVLDLHDADDRTVARDLAGGARFTARYRLATTLTDHHRYPAAALLRLIHTDHERIGRIDPADVEDHG